MLNRVFCMDEFLCEYVDDTMDCSVRVAFEECVECDSRLARQVRRLRGTRRLLCEYRSRIPAGLRSRVRRRLSRCLPFASPVRPPHVSILVGTATAIALAAALAAGTSQYTHASLSRLHGSGSAASVTQNQTKNTGSMKRVNAGALGRISSDKGS